MANPNRKTTDMPEITDTNYRHSFEDNRGDYHEEECSTCCECGEPITPIDDGHNDECSVFKSLIANVE